MGIRVPPDSSGQTVETNAPNTGLQRQVVTPGSATSPVTQAYTSNGESLVVVDNFPSVVNPIGVSGAVSVNNFPSVQNPMGVSGTVTVVQPIGSNLHVDVDNFPSTVNPIGVSGTVLVTQPLGSALHADIDNFPALQNVNVQNVVAVTGTVNVTGIIFSGAFTVPATVLQGTTPWVTTVTDGSGNVLGVSAHPLFINEAQLNGIALGNPTVYGTPPGGQQVQGVNAFVTNTVAASGTFTVVQSSGSALHVDVDNFPPAEDILRVPPPNLPVTN